MDKKSSQQQLVSVLMPVKNAGNFLVEAIESVRSQTYGNWELICIDDGSTDVSWEILKLYRKADKRIKIYRNRTTKGIGYCLNRAILLASGAYIARMDADDISLPDRFAKQITLLKNPNLVACGGQAAIIDSQGDVFAYKKFPTQSKKLYKMIMNVVPLQHPVLMAKSSVFKTYRYREDLPTAEDADMLFYLLSKGDLANVDSVIYKYRKSMRSNGYHNVKQTFYITFFTRFAAMKKYGYEPTLSGVLLSLAQFMIVTLLPSKGVVALFEAIRFEPPLWKRKFSGLNLKHLFVRFSQPALR